MGDKTLGGIGRLFLKDQLLSEVYYCVQQDQPNGPIYGSLVFVGRELDLPDNTASYQLFFEDNQCYILLSLFKEPTPHITPYSCIAQDGIFHPVQG